jgi:hypothetical protein
MVRGRFGGSGFGAVPLLQSESLVLTPLIRDVCRLEYVHD